ncbi:MAG: hypothetical protein IJV88_00025 [Ruminococcus sp.]|nr:hypothetical protein [Ruminococcus sp.]
MKRQYIKPMAAVEFYKLSQSIAACAINISAVDNACVVADNDTPEEMRSFAILHQNYFSTGCLKNAATVQNNDSICFHTQVNATFTSV